MSRSIRAGESIRLRARFRDDLGETVEAANTYVHIYEPDSNTSDISEAVLVSGVPSYLGEGIFEYEYPVTFDAEEGSWNDVWFGYSPNQVLSGIFTFEVVSGGTAETVDDQLQFNNLVIVTIPSGIMATDGTALSEEFEFEFLTTTSPSYTNIRKIRLEAGGFMNGIEEDAIQTAILEASIEADAITFATTATNNNVFQHARREYVTCLASYMLVQNTGNLMLKSKVLGDLEVEYDTRGLQGMLDKLRDCIDRWQPQVLTAGGAKAVSQPSYVVKGELDPDRPNVSRMWSAGNNGTINSRIPAANTRERPLGQRRYLRSFRPKWW